MDNTALAFQRQQYRELLRRSAGRVIKYINSNASGLKDFREDKTEYDSALRRTGAIDGNIDKLIVRRMKNQGMI